MNTWFRTDTKNESLFKFNSNLPCPKKMRIKTEKNENSDITFRVTLQEIIIIAAL